MPISGQQLRNLVMCILLLRNLMVILCQNELRSRQRMATVINFRLNFNAVILNPIIVAVMLLSISVQVHILVAMVHQQMMLMLLWLTIHRILVARLNVLVKV